MGYAECKHGKYCGHDCCVPDLCNEFEPVEETEVITIADRIRAMSDEELAKFLSGKPLCLGITKYKSCPFNCIRCWGEWLKQPADQPE